MVTGLWISEKYYCVFAYISFYERWFNMKFGKGLLFIIVICLISLYPYSEKLTSDDFNNKEVENALVIKEEVMGKSINQADINNGLAREKEMVDEVEVQ